MEGGLNQAVVLLNDPLNYSRNLADFTHFFDDSGLIFKNLNVLVSM